MKGISENRLKMTDEECLIFYKRYLEIKEFVPFDINIAKRLNISVFTMVSRNKRAKILLKKGELCLSNLK
jgi:hypothetical protein